MYHKPSNIFKIVGKFFSSVNTSSGKQCLRKNWSICQGILPKIGDYVQLTHSETVLKSELMDYGFDWQDEMKAMLGKVYEVLSVPKEVLSGTMDRIVALNSPNGEQNGKWFFPKIAVSCMEEGSR